jgi:Holliday junction resolvasome RuvABC endonuclease subunit
MRVVGIDASTNKTGVSLFINNEYSGHMLIDLHKIKDSNIRVPKMMQEIKNILDYYKPDIIVMEECLLKTNIATVKLLSYLAGAIISWAADNQVEFRFQLPSEWRKRVGLIQGPKISRSELKQEAIDMVKRDFGLDVNDDISESILIAKSAFYDKESKDIDIEI